MCFGKEMKFTVYSKDDCKHCKKIKTVMELTACDFVVYTLGVDFTKKQFYAEFGQNTTFPQVSVDGKKIGGSVETIRFLKEQQVIKG